jgi:DNA-binding NarL/FixJ family response regulator
LTSCRQAILAVAGGQGYFPAGIREAFRAGREHKIGEARLSKRESELLPLLARGLTLREAAERMTVSYKTADSYRTNLLRKLRVRDRVELARYAIRQGIIEP